MDALFRLHSHRDRAPHLGPLALERLPRAAAPWSAGDAEAIAGAFAGARPGTACAALPADRHAPSPHTVAHAIAEYQALFERFLAGPVARARAPIPDDPLARAHNLKASAYFLDATIAGVCALAPGEADDGHTHALVLAVELGREPAPGEPGDAWILGANAARTDLRATEIAAVLSGYVRAMGFAARGHAAVGHAMDGPAAGGDAAGGSDLELFALAVRAGVARIEHGTLVAPWLRAGFRLAAVTTDLALAPDTPLAPDGPLEPADAATWAGEGGTRPGWWPEALAARPLHLGRYPMERIARVDEPTTLVIRDEIGRVPKRGDFFKRAEAGDLGERARQEKTRFPFKHPFAVGMQPLIREMVPLQGERGPLAPTGLGGDVSDARRNADAVKALGYFLGADFVGVCRAEPWMWYSHDEVEGRPIEPYHAYAVVMLIDQGFETMEGASGDDWISASQSMRAYLRGAEIAGVMAAHCRRMGFSARSHSNAHSEIVHNPAILMAGLGEVSRIGDTILNPFIGPRVKSVVFTTDLPMTVDRPIDFGLQDFCSRCMKCARECPCNAIPFGAKVMFNGYEIWKADVERCTKYRVTQSRGSACGRCMKTCPWNREDTVEAAELIRRSIEEPAARDAIVAADDAAGAGGRNPVKRWWWDLEIVDGVCTRPAATNERDLDLGRAERLAKGQKLAMFPPALQPAGGTTLARVVPVDREAGLACYAAAESPEQARARLARGATPAGQGLGPGRAATPTAGGEPDGDRVFGTAPRR